MACSSSVYRGSDETSFQECTVCKFQNTTSEAMSYCTNCDEFLCTACEKVHRGSKLTRNHTLLTGSSLPSSTATVRSKPLIMFCEDHKTMIVNMYCQSHDDVICNTCKLSSHRRCNTTDINQQIKQMKKDGSLKDTTTRLEDLKSKCDKMKVMRNTDKGVVKSKLDKCLQDMHQLRKDINEAFDHIENILSMEIHQVYESTTKDIENHIAMLDDALTQISDYVKSLKECKKARDDAVMYVGMKKANNVSSKYEDIISKVENELDQTEITFQINEEVYDVVKDMWSIDTVLINNSRFPLQARRSLNDGQGTSGGVSYSSQIDGQGTGVGVPYSNQTDGQGAGGGISYSNQIQKSLINMSVSGKRDIGVGSTRVYGCTFTSEEHLVLCCGTKGLILLDKDFKVKFRLNINAHRVAVINRNEIFIVNDGVKQIQKVKLFPSMEVTKTMKTKRRCFDVDVSGDEIYVTCHDLSGNGEVQVLKMNGKIQRRLGEHDGEYMFRWPKYVTVNTDGSKVFVSDFSTGIVTCLDTQGYVIYQYSDIDLNHPTGMYVDREGYLLVCGYDNNNVYVLEQDGRKAKILLSKTDGVKRPWCTAFRQSDGCLVVGMTVGTNQSLISFSAK